MKTVLAAGAIFALTMAARAETPTISFNDAHYDALLVIVCAKESKGKTVVRGPIDYKYRDVVVLSLGEGAAIVCTDDGTK